MLKALCPSRDIPYPSFMAITSPRVSVDLPHSRNDTVKLIREELSEQVCNSVPSSKYRHRYAVYLKVMAVVLIMF
jgi:hypothetical protein